MAGAAAVYSNIQFCPRAGAMAEKQPSRSLQAAVSGDVVALEELLLSHHDRLVRRIGRRLPLAIRRTVSVEDVLQQTYAEAFRRITSFEVRGEGAFFRWLAEIADHRLADAIRSGGRAKRGGGNPVLSLDADSVARLLDVVVGDGDTPSRVVGRAEVVKAVQIGLAGLPENLRRPVELRYIEGMSVGEAAAALNLQPRTVRGLCYRGIRELRGIMGRSTQFFARR